MFGGCEGTGIKHKIFSAKIVIIHAPISVVLPNESAKNVTISRSKKHSNSQ